MKKRLLLCALWISMSAPSDAVIQITNNTSHELREQLRFGIIRADGRETTWTIRFSCSDKIPSFTCAPGETIQACTHSEKYVRQEASVAIPKVARSTVKYGLFLEFFGRFIYRTYIPNLQAIQNVRLIASETGLTRDTPISLSPLQKNTFVKGPYFLTNFKINWVMRLPLEKK